MPERLDPNVIDTITIFLADLPEDLTSQLQEAVSLTFDKEDYLLLDGPDVFRRDAKDAANMLVMLVDEKLQRGELAKVLPLRLNLALYTLLEPAASDRIDRLREIADQVGSKLGILNSYACIVKRNMQGEENAFSMDRCVAACEANEHRLQLPILLVNRGLGITIDLPLKASVRYLHMISRNSRLKGQLLARTELVTSIAMLEYDDEDAASLLLQIAKLQSELDGKEFSKTQMIESVQALMTEHIEQRLRMDRIAFSQMPIRADAIGNLFTILFRRKKLKHALRDVEQTLMAVYQKNIHEMDCDGGFQTEESRAELYERLESFPAAYFRGSFLSDLADLERNQPSRYDAYIPSLHLCLGEAKLREQLQGQYQRMLERSRAYMRTVVVREMKKQALVYVSSGRIEQREVELKDRILRLKAKARAVGNAQSAADFLRTQLSFLPTQGGVSFQNMMSCEMILLISKRIDENWNQYAKYLPNSPQFDVYNYGVLEDQELQALQLMRFNAELYRSNRDSIFQIG
jgi:hypothetical protein